MAEKIFMNVKEVAEVMELSESKCYKIIRDMNKKLEKEKPGCIIVPGRIDRKFFYEQFYSTSTN